MSTPAEQVVTLHRPRVTAPQTPNNGTGRWSIAAIESLFNLPFPELMHQAQTVHRQNFDPTRGGIRYAVVGQDRRLRRRLRLLPAGRPL